MSGSEFWSGFGIIMLIVAGCALGVAVVAMLASCVQNCRFIRSFRQSQRQRLSHLRIHRMLESLGVSRRRYLRKAFITDVETHLNRCQECPNTPECDTALRKGDVSNGDAFCPNFRALIGFRARRRTANGSE
jgi:hypothetical protein